MDDKLFNAILAMDSYNRGYNARIRFGLDPLNSTAVDGVTQIGNAVVYRSQNDQPAKDIGFYAIAYYYASQVTIAYRGTDEDINILTINGVGVN